jgi:integrase
MVRAKQKTTGTHRVQFAVMASLVNFFRVENIEDVNNRMAMEYIADRVEAGLAPSTINAHLRVLRTLLNFAQDAGYITEVPRLRSVRERIKNDTLPDPKTVEAFLKTLDQRHADALRFSQWTGLSWHEVERIEWQDITTNGTTTSLEIGERFDFTTKTEQRRRTLPLSMIARNLLKEIGRGSPTDKIFPAAKGTRDHMNRMRTHKFGGITPATMRKMFASAVARTAPEVVLQKLLGHAPGSTVTRKHYVRDIEGDLYAAMASAGKVLKV